MTDLLGKDDVLDTAWVCLPLPHTSLSPNKPIYSRGGRINKAKQAKKCKEMSKAYVEQMGLDTPWGKVRVWYKFLHKLKRPRDDDNYIAMMKAYRDGIVQAGLVKDDSSEFWVTGGAKFDIDREDPRVEILIERLL